ncbi:CHASE2 domain-containing protein [Burkholderia latens]|uniref:histidine kinase n=1 Tax=Burkholderia latens TaxID=488446 RepID=A0A6H9SS52_9BURK|nr:CHASE2 domain-containing protein [Burkholderia latens]KAB0643955.1 CHASE2 domain-containing protein [Burkholderia latens]VWC17845.1 integral membrane sensor signal transduction histidine kinase [Burkholderia latens]
MLADDARIPGGFMRECIVTGALVLLLCAALTASGALRRADLFFFDVVQPLLQRPSPHKIVLIAIDAASAKALGGWPVKRADYATLIDRLTAAGAAAIGLDVALTHPGRILPAGDAWLASAIERNGRVVLPAVVADDDGDGLPNVAPPLEPIARGAFAIAHVNAAPDADGVSRSFYLREGPPNIDYEHMSASLLRASGVPFDECDEAPVRRDVRWTGACRRYVPLGSAPSYHTIPFVDALEGRVDPGLLNDAIVLVGPTAGTADTHFVTPGWEPPSRAGVEFVAQATYALASGSLVRSASWVAQFLFSVSVLPWLCAALCALGPRAALLACAAIAAAACTVSLLMLKTAHLFCFPATAVAACLLAYALSAWRRQETLLRYLTREAERAIADPYLPGDAPAPTDAIDPFRRRVIVMTAMIARLRRSAHLISEWINSLPEATLVASGSGAVMLANRRALTLYETEAAQRGSPPPATGRHAAHVLREMTASNDAAQYVQRALRTLAEHNGVAPASESSARMDGIEIVDAKQRSLLVKCAIVPAHEGSAAMLIFHVADVTPMRAAERQRDTALRFLSHDMRSPQAAILALIDQRREAPASLPEARFTDLVGHYARTTLTLADQFLLLARAQARSAKATEVDLAPLLGDATDDMWAHANTKRIKIRLIAEPGMLVVADALLLRRAFANLIDNAIRFSPEGSTVTVEAGENDERWRVTVADTGIGIPEHQLPNLFTEFFRVDASGATAGHGLGLAFVKQVVDALGGEIRVESAVGRGSVFTLLLPRNGARRDD